MTSSKFPGAIDGYSEIRVVRNNIEEIVGNDHNSLRSATLNIERCLGINPQGHFGTVVERLNNGAQDIVDHASGASPRHYDDHIDALVKSGSPWGLASGTVETQVQQLLDYENEFLATTGAGLVGAAAFNTPGNEYSFEGLTVQDQIEEAGSFLDENANYLMRAFDSFVVSGMLVTPHNSADLMVNVASGYVSGQGRLIHYDAQVSLVLLTAPGVGEYYVYARRNANTIEISGVSSANLSTVLDPENPIVLLAKITLTAGPNASSFDIRKFGVSSSSKNGFSVGTKPTSGRDGYGCDFISLSAAVEYIKALRDSGKNIGPSRIILVSDLVINSNINANIALPSGIEIDGCGNKILFLVDNCLFYINNSNIILKNISVETNVGSFSALSNLIFVAQTGNIKNLYINNVILTNLSSPMHYFMRFGPYTLSDSIICNCSVEVERGGFSTVDDLATGNPITGCSIFNNRIYQTPFSVSSYNGIVIGSNNKVYGNVIDGGFTYGIVIRQSNYGNSISDNTIIGYRYDVVSMENIVHMGTGIYTNNSNNISVTNNIIKGINTHGINCSSIGTLLSILVTGNSITNRDVSSTPPAATIGIFGSVNGEVSASNNMITYMRGSSIKNVKEIKNNYIVDYILENAVNSIYVDGCDYAVIESNYIKDSAGQPIYLVGCNNSVVNNNKIISPCVHDSVYNNAIHITGCNYVNLSNNSIIGIVGGGSSSFGVKISMSSYCNVTNNFVYKLDSAAFIIEARLVSGSIIGSNFCNFDGNYVVGTTYGFVFNYDNFDGYDCTNSVIKNNILIGDATYIAQEAVYYPGAASLISNNYIYGFGNSNGGICTCVIKLDTTSDDCIIHGNYILNCFGNGIECNGSSGLSICDNQFKMLTSFASSGIIDVGTNSLISNNIFSGYSGLYGVSTGAVSGVTIIGNSFTNIGAGMMKVFYIGDGSTGIEISDNYVSNAPGNAIDLGDGVTGVTQILISGNYISSYADAIQSGSFSNTDVVISNNYIIILGANNGIHNYLTASAPNWHITNNKIIGTAASSKTAIKGVGSNSFVSNNYIDKFGASSGYGIITSSTSASGINIINNFIYRPDSTMDSAIKIGNASSSGNHINGNIIGTSGVGLSKYGIHLNATVKSTCCNNIIYGSDVDSTYHAIYSVGSGSATTEINSINNNFIVKPNGHGIYVGTFHKVSGNHIIMLVSTAKCGIYVTSDSSASNNYITGGVYGIYISASLNSIDSNIIRNSTIAGIFAATSANKQNIIGNYINQTTAAIGIKFNSTNNDSKISSNYIYNTTSSITCISSNNCSITDNYILTCETGITYDTGDFCNIANNYINGASSISISLLNGASGGKISSNYLYSAPYGIKIDASDYNKISSNCIRSITTSSIWCLNSNYCSMTDNYILTCITGIICDTGDYYDISNNYISGFTSIGISLLGGATNGKILSNYLYRSGVVGTTYGIKVDTCNNNKISSNYIYNTASSISCATSNYCSITDNYIVTCTIGITCSVGDYCDIINNYLSEFTDIGIWLSSSATNGKISSNYLYLTSSGTSTYGIKMDASSNNKISSNYIYNTISSIWCYNSNNCSIAGNYILTCTTGITYDTGDYCDIINNYISGFTSIGIWLSSSATNGKISSNYLYRSGAVGTTYGVKIDTSSNNKISSNYIYNTASSIACLSSNNCSINDNYILTCTTGITCSIGVHCDVANNYISEFTSIGISLLSSANDCKISSNYLYLTTSGTTNGIKVDTCENSKISSNYIYNAISSINCIASNCCSIIDNYILTCTIGITHETGNYCDITNNYISGFTMFGIYLSGNPSDYVTSGKISSNYLYLDTPVVAGTYGIAVETSHNNKISSNYIHSTENGIVCITSNSCSITDNYIAVCTTGITYNAGDCYDIANNYISEFTSKGIYLLTSANGGKISSNYLYLTGTQSGDVYGIEVNSCNNSFISSNYIFNYLTSSGANPMYAIRALTSDYISVNANYILCNSQLNTTSIRIQNCSYVNILSNNLYLIGTYGIYISADSTEQYFNICSNYITGSGANVVSCINISDTDLHKISMSNNYIVISSNIGDGIYFGNSSTPAARNISCSSNMVTVGASPRKAFSYTGTSIRLIGNVAIGGDNPGSWSTTYNATITSGVVINEIMNVYTA